MATQLANIFRENDLLNDFLDRMLLRAYEQLRKQTGSHSKAARLQHARQGIYSKCSAFKDYPHPLITQLN